MAQEMYDRNASRRQARAGTRRARAGGRDPSPESPPVVRTALRASDAEREQVVAQLRAHGADGRLDLDELSERTEVALLARTREELDALTADLPPLPRDQAGRLAGRRAALRSEIRVYAGVIALLVALWLLTGAGHPWPAYPALGWGFALFLQSSGAKRGARRSARTRAARA